MNKVTISAPGKIMLFGEHAVVWGRPCIVTAVDARMTVKVWKTSGQKIRIKAPQVGISGYERNLSFKGPTLRRGKVGPYTKGIEFIESAIEKFSQEFNLDSGLSIETKNSFSLQYGLGSSSAVTVCLIKALSEIFNLNLSKREIFDLAYQVVLDVQSVGSGFDVAAAVWGGTLYYLPCSRKIIPLHLSEPEGRSKWTDSPHFSAGRTSKIGEIPLVLVYSGIKAKTPKMIDKVQNLRKEKFAYVEGIFDKISQLVEKAKAALVERNWQVLGELMNQNQKFLTCLGVSTVKIDKLIAACLQAGALGAKISGAGGGDCLIALASEKARNKVEQAIVGAGGILLSVKTGAEGVRREIN